MKDHLLTVALFAFLVGTCAGVYLAKDGIKEDIKYLGGAKILGTTYTCESITESVQREVQDELATR